MILIIMIILLERLNHNLKIIKKFEEVLPILRDYFPKLSEETPCYSDGVPCPSDEGPCPSDRSLCPAITLVDEDQINSLNITPSNIGADFSPNITKYLMPMKIFLKKLK